MGVRDKIRIARGEKAGTAPVSISALLSADTSSASSPDLFSVLEDIASGQQLGPIAVHRLSIRVPKYSHREREMSSGKQDLFPSTAWSRIARTSQPYMVALTADLFVLKGRTGPVATPAAQIPTSPPESQREKEAAHSLSYGTRTSRPQEKRLTTKERTEGRERLLRLQHA